MNAKRKLKRLHERIRILRRLWPSVADSLLYPTHSFLAAVLVNGLIDPVSCFRAVPNNGHLKFEPTFEYCSFSGVCWCFCLLLRTNYYLVAGQRDYSAVGIAIRVAVY